MTKFTQASLEAAIIQLLGGRGYRHEDGKSPARTDQLGDSLLTRLMTDEIELGE